MGVVDEVGSLSFVVAVVRTPLLGSPTMAVDCPSPGKDEKVG